MNEPFLENIKELISPRLAEQGVELVDLILARGRRRSTLRFLVDVPGGITLNECARLNKEIGKILDRESVVGESYVLEVSSPGLDRPLTSTRDFERVGEQLVRVVLHQPLNGQNVWKGTIESVDEQNLTIITDEQQKRCIPRKNIARAKIEVKFG